MAEQTEIKTSVPEEPKQVTSNDDELDEDFIQQPKEVDIPSSLSNEELTKMNDMIKNKSNKKFI